MNAPRNHPEPGRYLFQDQDSKMFIYIIIGTIRNQDRQSKEILEKERRWMDLLRQIHHYTKQEEVCFPSSTTKKNLGSPHRE